MKNEASLAAVPVVKNDGHFSETHGAINVLFARGSTVDYEKHRDALKTVFDSCKVQTETLDAELGSVESTVDVFILAGVMNIERHDAVIDAVRAQNPDCRVLGLIETDSSIDLARSSLDEALVHPVSSEDLIETVDRLRRRQVYHRLVQEHLALASKLATLETVNTTEELELNEQYTTLSEEMTIIEQKYTMLFDDFDDSDFRALIREIER